MRFTDEPSLQVIHLERPHPRETMCGDMAMIARKEGRLRVAIADGLGHGPQAREAADVTTRWLRASAKESLEEAVLVAHENTAATRGSTLGIAELDLKTQTVTATTIGNVRVGIYQNTGRVWSPCGTDAVLGHGRGSFHGKLEIRVEKFQLPPGGLLILFSDGLSSQLRLPLSRPQALEEHPDPHDRGHQNDPHQRAALFEQFREVHGDAGKARASCCPLARPRKRPRPPLRRPQAAGEGCSGDGRGVRSRGSGRGRSEVGSFAARAGRARLATRCQGGPGDFSRIVLDGLAGR